MNTKTVVFERGRKGDLIARIDGKIAFPARGQPQPQEGDEWEIEVIGTNPAGSVFFLRLIRRISTAEERRNAWDASRCAARAAQREALQREFATLPPLPDGWTGRITDEGLVLRHPAYGMATLQTRARLEAWLRREAESARRRAAAEQRLRALIERDRAAAERMGGVLAYKITSLEREVRNHKPTDVFRSIGGLRLEYVPDGTPIRPAVGKLFVFADRATALYHAYESANPLGRTPPWVGGFNDRRWNAVWAVAVDRIEPITEELDFHSPFWRRSMDERFADVIADFWAMTPEERRRAYRDVLRVPLEGTVVCHEVRLIRRIKPHEEVEEEIEE